MWQMGDIDGCVLRRWFGMTVTGLFDDPEVNRSDIHETYHCDSHIYLAEDFKPWMSSLLDRALGIDTNALVWEWSQEGREPEWIAQQLAIDDVRDVDSILERETEKRENHGRRGARKPRAHASYASLLERLRNDDPRAFQVFVDVTEGGKKQTEVAVQLGVSIRSVQRLLAKAATMTGLNWRERRYGHPRDQEAPRASMDARRVAALVKIGHGYADIAELLGWTEERVTKGIFEAHNAGLLKGIVATVPDVDVSPFPVQNVATELHPQEPAPFQRPDSSGWDRGPLEVAA